MVKMHRLARWALVYWGKTTMGIYYISEVADGFVG